MPEASFEDMLKPSIKCRTCSFLANLQSPLREQVVAAVAKPIYSNEQLAAGMRKVETEFNLAPGERAIRNHREKGHVS